MLGQVLGHYSVIEKIGAGGMGEVYRAHDQYLSRDVAIKVVPEIFSRDRDRLMRFEREARLLASLNHPNIATIYGLEESNGTRFLVLELVPGQTLGDRLATGPFALGEALEIARQIAEALEAAHQQGIIHRDLKPANIKVIPEGDVKILDFGLAHVLTAESTLDPAHSPTTLALTREGIILGTAAYMSPEQARGQPTSKRTDIWSFGCVLYEMLTGCQAFSGDTASDIIAAVLKTEPAWSLLPSETPWGIRLLLQRCLRKDLNSRLRDIGDARLEIEETLTGNIQSANPAPVKTRASSRRWLPWLALLLMAVVAAIGIWGPWRRPESLAVSRFVIPAPGKERMEVYETPNVAFSPDGSRIAYVTAQGSNLRLYVREIKDWQAKLLSGTEGANSPFFSPDSQWIGFFAGGAMKKVGVNGGLPIEICEAAVGRGASWSPDGTIIFARNMSSGLFRVSASGGTPEAVTTLNAAAGERTHRWPQVLPGGDAVLFTVGSVASPEYFLDARIAVQSLNGGQRKIVLEGGTNARYIDPGYLIYVSSGGLFAVPFDLNKLRTTGQSMRILENVATDITTGASQFSVSRDGSLAYVAGITGAVERKLFWIDRHGLARDLPAPPRNYVAARLSPDAHHLVTVIGGSGDSDVWLYDLQRNTLTRLTTEQGTKIGPLWTPDGKRVVYGAATRGHGMNVMWKPVDGSGPARALLSGSESPMLIPSSWSADGKLLLLDRLDPGGRGFDEWVLPIEGERQTRPLLQSKFSEQWGVISPNGLWLAYVSDETGSSEVYVQSFPGLGNRIQISELGGFEPAWSRSGRELFYRTGENMMVVPVETEKNFKAGTPRALFEDHYDFSDYDVAPDGAHLLMIKGRDESSPTQLNVVLNWHEEWKRARP